MSASRFNACFSAIRLNVALSASSCKKKVLSFKTRYGETCDGKRLREAHHREGQSLNDLRVRSVREKGEEALDELGAGESNSLALFLLASGAKNTHKDA